MTISNKFRLDNKVAIITGASKGIGKAIAMAMGQQGAKIVITGRRQESLDLVVNKFLAEGIEATGITAHMGDMDQIKNLVEKTVQHFGGIDIIVNNAATNPAFGPVAETDHSVFNKIMDVNVKGPLHLCKLAFPYLKQSGTAAVINISSIEGITPGTGLGLYSVSKAALIALTKVLAKEWGVDKIRANVICPGLVKTKFSEALTGNETILKHVMARQALPQLAEPEDIAGLALFLASDAASFCTGGVFTADGGYTI